MIQKLLIIIKNNKIFVNLKIIVVKLVFWSKGKQRLLSLAIKPINVIYSVFYLIIRAIGTGQFNKIIPKKKPPQNIYYHLIF